MATDNYTKDINNDDFDLSSVIDDTEEIIDIPLDNINEEARKDSMSIIHYLIDEKYTKEFLDEHPDLKKNVEMEKEGLRNLIKMKKSNEVVHDILMKAIGKKADNASLYMSLSRMEATNLSIQKQIDEKIEAMKKLLKNYQAELNFDLEQAAEENPIEDDNVTVVRGTRDFIKQMKKVEDTKQLSFDNLMEDD